MLSVFAAYIGVGLHCTPNHRGNVVFLPLMCRQQVQPKDPYSRPLATHNSPQSISLARDQTICPVTDQAQSRVQGKAGRERKKGNEGNVSKKEEKWDSKGEQGMALGSGGARQAGALERRRRGVAAKLEETEKSWWGEGGRLRMCCVKDVRRGFFSVLWPDVTFWYIVKTNKKVLCRHWKQFIVQGSDTFDYHRSVCGQEKKIKLGCE